MADPVYTLAIEFVSGSYTNITSDCLHLSFTRELANYDRGLSIGKCEIILQNEERKYSPTYSGGPYYPNLKPNKRVRLQATYSSSTYSLFSGFIDTFTIDPITGNRIAYLQASDRIKELDRREVNLPFAINYNVGSLVTDVLSYMGVVSSDRAVDLLPDKVSFAWFNNQKGTTNINELLTFGNYQAYVGGNGVINLFNRIHNWEGTLTSSLTEFLGFNYALDEVDVANILRIESNPRKLSTVATIAWLQTIETIPASGHASFWLHYIDPINNESPTPANSVIFPVSDDYFISTQPTSGGVNLSSTTSVNGVLFGTTAVFSLFNGSGNIAYINKFQVRGYPLQRQPRIVYEREVSSSQTAYGKRSYTITSDLIDDLYYAKDYATFLVDKKKDPVDHISFSIKNQWPKQLLLELGTLVSVIESQTAINSTFLVTGVSHNIELARGLEHTTEYQVELGGTQTYLVLDSTPYGKLNDGRKLSF